MSPFKLSACSANYGHEDLYKVVDRLAELNFDGVEITVMYHAKPGETSSAKRKEILKRVKDAGLAVSGLHFIFPSGLSMVSDLKDERKRVVDHVGSVIDLAHDLEAPIVMVGGGGMRTPTAGMERSKAVNNVCDTFRGIAERANGTGVIACFEALNRFESGIGRGFAEVCGYLDQIGMPSLKLGGDTFHMNIEEPSMPASIEMAGSRLAHLHLPDSHRLAPGGGHIDFPPILRALKKIDYAGYLSFELFWIAPDIPYLETYELCDAENVKAINCIRKLEEAL